MSAPVLVAEGISVRFGGVQVLADITVDVPANSITGLIGPNGAGKTTLFNVITGLVSPTAGRILLDGRDVGRLSTHRRARLGVGRTFQRLELFTELSVRDNLRVAHEIRSAWQPWANRSERQNAASETDRVLDLIGLRHMADAAVSEIPTGVARVVELGRALMIRPRVLLLDEPASGQSDDETHEFGHLLRRLVRDEGVTILLVEHDMTLVMEVCERIHVLDHGHAIASGGPHEIRTNAAVVDAYLGATTVTALEGRHS